ncbi:Hypothetical predicted protein [Lecanosticta acicola]|uniref:Thioredoxin domain-containing protein n=1 Tax=Lecanosticta acicola TaxID=111012 RepID=A0AAI9EFU1_9PEZI|nr:Hypothetical predicted protein [Lecanosticta acicola]
MRVFNPFAALRGQSITLTTTRRFSSSPRVLAKNRVYPSRIRNPSELDTLILMSSSTRMPLLTLWTTTWDPSTPQTSEILKSLIEDERTGEDKGGVSFAEVEMDSPDLGGVSGVGMERYRIDKVPTLIAFDRGEAQVATKVVDLVALGSREFLREWIEREAARHGEGGAGGGGEGRKHLFGGNWMQRLF